MNLKSLAAATTAAMIATGASAKEIDMQAIFPGSLPLLGKPAFDIVNASL